MIFIVTFLLRDSSHLVIEIWLLKISSTELANGPT